jgi:uncharacterized repeat protein (TIGR01451 family)
MEIFSCRSAHARRKLRPRIEPVESRLLLSVFTVTTVADSGLGSFRQAILDSNADGSPSTIDFSINSGPQTIVPTTALPTITNPTTIDATTQPGFSGRPIIQLDGSRIFFPSSTNPIPDVTGITVNAGSSTVRGLVINRFTGNGIGLVGNGRNVIAGNYIGVDTSGTNSLGNGADGILVVDSRNNTIGGTIAADRDIISGNGASGIEITSANNRGLTGGNVIEGDLIGTDVSGTSDLGNGFDGVTSNTSANVVGGTVPGAGNTIAFNGGDGVRLNSEFFFFPRPLAITILTNSIFANSNLGIDFGFDVVNPVSATTLTSAFESGGSTIVEGRFIGAPDTAFTVQFFSNPTNDGQGRTFVSNATITTGDDGSARFSVALPTSIPLNQFVSATATDPGGNSSPFFASARVTARAVADLAVFQSSSPSPVTAGTPLVYTVNVFNGGPSRATGVVLTDTLPEDAVVTSVKTTHGTVTQTGGVVTVAFDTIESGDTESVTITVVPPTPGVATNVASATADQFNALPDQATSSLDTTVAINGVPPVIVSQRLVVGLHSINAIILTFNEPLDPLQATNPINYALLGLGKGKQFNVPIALKLPVYNAKAQTVTLTPLKPLALGKVYELVINGQGSAGVTDLAGNLLIGNTPSAPLGPYVSLVSRGVIPPTPKAPKPGRGGSQVKLVESVTARRVLTGPATTSANGTLLNNLPPLTENTSGQNSISTLG